MQELTAKQNAIILGGLLGDMHIQKNHKSSNGNCRLCFSHTLKQKDYIVWKFRAFEKAFCTLYKDERSIRRSTRTKRRCVYFLCLLHRYTERRPEFKGMYDNWYVPTTSTLKDRIKTIPFDLHKIFTDPLALAVWYLDDGTKRKDTASCRLATQSFSKEGNEILQACVFQNFGIRSNIESWGRNKAGKVTYQLAILSSRRTGDYNKFRDLLYPIVKAEIPSMLYKLQ